MLNPPFTVVSSSSPRGCSHEEIKEVFSKYGKLYGDGLRFATDKKDDRFLIDYAVVGAAVKALKALHGQICPEFGPSFKMNLQYSRETKLKLIAMGLLEEPPTKVVMPQRIPAGTVVSRSHLPPSVLAGTKIDLKPLRQLKPPNSSTSLTVRPGALIRPIGCEGFQSFKKTLTTAKTSSAKIMKTGKRDCINQHLESLIKQKKQQQRAAFAPSSITPIIPHPSSSSSSNKPMLPHRHSRYSTTSESPFHVGSSSSVNVGSYSSVHVGSPSPLLSLLEPPTATAAATPLRSPVTSKSISKVPISSSLSSSSSSSLLASSHSPPQTSQVSTVAQTCRAVVQASSHSDNESTTSSRDDDDDTSSNSSSSSSSSRSGRGRSGSGISDSSDRTITTGDQSGNNSETDHNSSSSDALTTGLKSAFQELLAGLSNAPASSVLALDNTPLSELAMAADDHQISCDTVTRTAVNKSKLKKTKARKKQKEKKAALVAAALASVDSTAGQKSGQECTAVTDTETATGSAGAGSATSVTGTAGGGAGSAGASAVCQGERDAEANRVSTAVGCHRQQQNQVSKPTREESSQLVITPYMTITESILGHVPNESPAAAGIKTQQKESTSVPSSSVKIHASSLIATVKESLDGRKQKHIEETKEKETENRAIEKTKENAGVVENEVVEKLVGEPESQAEQEANIQPLGNKAVSDSQTVANVESRKRMQLTRRATSLNDDNEGLLEAPKQKRRLIKSPKPKVEMPPDTIMNSNNTAINSNRPSISTSLVDKKQPQYCLLPNSNVEANVLNSQQLSAIDVQRWLSTAQQAIAIHSGLFLVESSPSSSLVQLDYSSTDDWIVHSIGTRAKQVPKTPIYSQPFVLFPALFPFPSDAKPFQNLLLGP